MEREKLKSALWVITYTVGLVLVVIRIEDILRGAGIFLGLLRPLLLGIVIAFVLDHPYECLRGWYRRRWRLRDKRAKLCAVVSVYVLALGAIAALIGIVGPEVVRNLMAFAASADSYLLEVQRGVNAFTDAFGLSPIDLTELIALVNGYLRNLTQAIGVARPTSVRVDTFGTGAVSDSVLQEALCQVFDFRPGSMIQELDLRRPIYRQTAVYGHFGRSDLDLPWAQTDRTEALQSKIMG